MPQNPALTGLLNAPPAVQQQKPLQPGYPSSGLNWLDTGVQGTLGAVGLGDDSHANRGGALLSSALPFMGLAGRAEGIISKLGDYIGTAGLIPKKAAPALEGLRGASFSTTPSTTESLAEFAPMGGEASYNATNAAQAGMQPPIANDSDAIYKAATSSGKLLGGGGR